MRKNRASAEAGRSLPAVILGGETTALSVARSLHARGIAVQVLSHSRSPARFSRAVTGFVDVGSEDPQERMLEWLIARSPPAVLLAGSDDGLEVVARHRLELEACGHRPFEGNDPVLLSMLDKLETYRLARQAGIATPAVVRLRDPEEAEAAVAALAFPCVLKPVHSHLYSRRVGDGRKVIVVEGAAQLRREVARLAELGVEVFATEVIRGRSDEYVSYYGYLDRDGEPLLALTKRKLRQWPAGFGTGTYHETTRDSEVAAAGERFLRAVGMRGLGNVEFKRDERNGRLVLIECNARFTLANELIQAAGIDLALFCYDRALGRATAPGRGTAGAEAEEYRVGVRLWDPLSDLRALRDYRRRGELSVAAWARSLDRGSRLPAFRVDDPAPGMARLAWQVGDLLPRPRDGARRAARAVAARRPAVLDARPLPAPVRQPPPPGGRSERLSVQAGPFVRALDAIGRRDGRRARALAARIDIARSYGLLGLPRRLRAEGWRSGQRAGDGRNRLSGDDRDRLYEGIWAAAAALCGAELSRLGSGLLEIRRGGTRTRVYRQMVELDDAVTLQVAVDKALVYGLMAELGIAHPEYVEWTADDLERALSFLAEVGGPCVVKPAAGTAAGMGVVGGIESPEDLIRARWHAGWDADRLLIERQAAGAVYRLLLLDGELLDVVVKQPPQLTGDGRATVATLIGRENRRRAHSGGVAGSAPIVLTLDVILAFRRAGLSLSSVPAAGQRVPLGVVTNRSSSRESHTWRGGVAASVLEDARRLADRIGLRLAGLDVVTPDITSPLAQTGGVVTEINGTPGLHHHYLVADPANATAVAVPILERLLGGPR